MASGHGAFKPNMALHPNRQVGADRFRQGIGIVHPTPDGGISDQEAGPIIQENWAHLRDLGMSAEDATARLHGDMSIPIPEEQPSDDESWFHPGPPTHYTNSFGPAGQFINRFVEEQA